MPRKQNNFFEAFETLESRTLMSAAIAPHVAPHVAPHRVAAAATHIKLTQTEVNPAVTDKSITYQDFSSDPLFASAGPTAADVNQGCLGDCYLLATLSSVVSTDPALIEKDIVSDGNGLYTVSFGGSKPTEITVNTELPVWPDGQLAYAQLGQQNSLWVALMEKAYVQYANPKADSYAAINGGWMSTAFSALGIKSRTTQVFSSASNLLTTLASDLKAGDFTTFGTDASLASDSPLIGGHAYEVSSVNTAADTITLRNPWGDAVADDGLVTITAQQAFAAFCGVVIAEV